jgi:hypothetical protein
MGGCINNYENKVTEERDTINVFHHWHHAYIKAIEHFSTRIQDNPATTALNITALKWDTQKATVRRFQLKYKNALVIQNIAQNHA